MKASTLIYHLASIIEDHGDLNVKILHIDESPCDKIDCVSVNDNNEIILEIEY